MGDGAGIVERVVDDQVDTRRLSGLLRIGNDEVSYRRRHRYLTVVADHDQAGRLVWAAEGKNAATLEPFYDEPGEAGCTALEAVSMDLGAAFKKATDTKAPQARQCVEPFYADRPGQRGDLQGPPLGLGTVSGPVSLIWPHCDGLIWPTSGTPGTCHDGLIWPHHEGSVAVLLAAFGRGRSGEVEGGVVRGDTSR